MRKRKVVVSFLLGFSCWILMVSCLKKRAVDENYGPEGQAKWTEERIHEWYGNQPWILGSNFIPSTAINQIEMWQKSTYDPATIDQELEYAEEIGMNSMRVYIHYLVWKEEGALFLDRMDDFLERAHAHHMRILFVFLDDCWDPNPLYGKQKDPEPYVHNSGWVQCPGWEILSDTGSHHQLKPYVQDILARFADDDRILGWDLYNEPGNLNRISYDDPDHKPDYSLILLQKVFFWAREVNPSQPLTTGVWIGDWSHSDSLSALNKFSLDHSDFISFHCYHNLEGFKQFHTPLKRYNRPVICTEFMSRGSEGLFKTILPYMKEQDIGGYNWGLVGGKTQTIYSWESWIRDISGEADFWYHDILWPDGTPYDQDETNLIRSMMTK